MRLAVLAAAALAAAPAIAQPQPIATLPKQDVTVTYRLEGGARDAVPGGLPETVRLLWDAAHRRLRVEPQGRSQVLLVDLATSRAELLDTGLHGVVTLPMRREDVDPIMLQGARLTPKGGAVVAGLACTEYDVVSRRGNGVVCLTGNGVALKGAGTVDGRGGSFVALAVTPGPVPDSAFIVPAGFMRLAIPRLDGLR